MYVWKRQFNVPVEINKEINVYDGQRKKSLK